MLDFSGGMLDSFAAAPHCGVSLNGESEGDIDRLFDFLDQIIGNRKHTFTNAGVSNFESYLTVDSMPLILVVIDNVVGFNAFKKGSDYLQELHRYLRDGLNCGIRFILTASQLNQLNPKARAEIKYRLALQLKDKYEYGDALNTKVSYLPPEIKGRGLCIYDARPLEFHAAKFRPNLPPLDAGLALKSAVSEIAGKYPSSSCAEKLSVVQENQTYEEFSADVPLGRIPLGYALSNAKKISIPLKQAFCLSLYFGNPDGFEPVLGNFFTAFNREHADYLIVPALDNSLLGENSELLRKLSGQVQFFAASEDGAGALWSTLSAIIEERKKIRNRYCTERGLDFSEIQNLAQAADTIRTDTQPVCVVFERFADFCRNAGDLFPKLMPALMQVGRYYNLYFIGCFRPGDTTGISAKPVFTAFNPDKNVLLFGGRTDQQELVHFDFRSSVKEMLPRYSRGLMSYRGKTHAIYMPCGEESTGQISAEDASIFE